MSVKRAPEPVSFDADVRTPGNRALDELLGKLPAKRRAGRPRESAGEYSAETDIPASKLPPFWTAALPGLCQGYNHTCAYLGLRIDGATGTTTVDHFIHKASDRRKAYEWDNLRLASHRVNTFKGVWAVLDPFTIGDGWFELDLFSHEVVANKELSASQRSAVEDTIKRLRLNDDGFVWTRSQLTRRYRGFSFEDGEPTTPWSLADLKYFAPFIAHELRRQGQLNPGDA